MIGSVIKRGLRRLRGEAGTVSLEFVLIFPVMATMIVMTLEMGFITLRQTMVERGLDMAVREVRLGTGTSPQHDDIKELVCENAMILVDCEEKMYLEMVASDARNFQQLNEIALCTDQPVEARPARVFVPGQPNEIVMMRVCLNYEPIFPEALLGRMLTTDANGDAAITAVTAFVQEPR